MNGRAYLVVPLVIVALLGAGLGFVVTRALEPAGPKDSSRVSVVTLPSTPTPKPTTTPVAKSENRVTVNGRSGRSGSTGDDRCPAGCQCEFPPNGMIVVCR
jgi:hypothetical protein